MKTTKRKSARWSQRHCSAPARGLPPGLWGRRWEARNSLRFSSTAVGPSITRTMAISFSGFLFPWKTVKYIIYFYPFEWYDVNCFWTKKTTKVPHFFSAKANVEDDIEYISLDCNDWKCWHFIGKAKKWLFVKWILSCGPEFPVDGKDAVHEELKDLDCSKAKPKAHWSSNLKFCLINHRNNHAFNPPLIGSC